MATKGGENETPLTTNNAINKLSSVGFRFTHWREVARHLQIKQDDKDKYMSRHYGDDATALEECVDDWLRNSREPTWDKFLHIIAAVDKSAAKRIRYSIGLPSVREELTALELLSDDQLTALGDIPSSLVGRLEAEGIAGEGESGWLKDVTTWKEVIKGFIQILKNNTDSKKEIKFGNILSLYEETATIGRDMLLEKPLTPVALSPTYQSQFVSLFHRFAMLLEEIRPKLTQKLPPQKLKDLKRYIKRQHHIDEKKLMEFENCKNMEEALDLVEDSCSCTNISLIKNIASKYQCVDAQEDISKYEEGIDSFANHLRDSLKNRLPVYLCRDRTEPLLCERLEFTLEWEANKASYETIKFILYKAFEDIAKNINVIRINGGSVTVLCRIPHSLVPLAIYKAQKNMEFLQKHCMISLTIGYMTVIAKSIEKKVEEEETITAEHYPQKEEGFEEDITASDTKDETVNLQKIKEELEEKKRQCLQLEERCSKWENIAQSSATDQMTEALLEQLKEYQEKEQNFKRIVAERDFLAEKLSSSESEKKELLEKLTDKENQLMSLVQIEELTQHELAKEREANKLIQQEVQTLQNEKKEAETVMGEMKEKNEKLQTGIADEREKAEKMEAEKEKLQSELDTVKIMKKRMMEENEELRKVKEEYEKLQADIAGEREKAEKMEAEKEKLQSELDTVKIMKKRMMEENEELRKVKEEYEKLQADIADEREKAEKMAAEKEEEMAAEKEKLQENLDDAKKMKKAIMMENETLKKEKGKYEAQIKEIKLTRVPTLHDDWRDSEPHTLPVEVLMTSFDSHHKSNKHWYSPSFYSHEKGYKLCLRVRANGESQGSGTHLSIHIHLMRGDYDDVLKWPVRGKVTLEILNRNRDKNHFSGDIEFNDDSNPEATGRVINGIQISSGTAAFVGQGGATFVPQDLLFQDHLKDDSIRIRVARAEMEPQGASVVPSEAPTGKSAVVEFRVNKFSALKKSNGSYVSEPFYTHEKGYKFVFMVYPNGVGGNKGKNVSIFAHLTRGENDDQLKFPFRGEFTLQAVNCRDTNKDHAEKVIRINEFTDPKETYGSRVAWYNVTGRALNGYGFPEFLAHEQLAYNEKNNTQYLDDNDSMLFRVTNITVNSM
ncbi:PREDICTED: WEB family protein At4g27595, chloroplastic-like [Amphimedon queenslandica]|uniref:MATH domain-containing protein n=2 Tax=Amphimedon queenslandica TaxID=400682 RepID=A0AAN0JLD7_AMPQE|nr:PREDICTED: WEB family protein At4g27595, chloroplastic-like [Amphimedon queenslandica]|eukprot:XP_019857635.1 PREDICTED: WEB family protein At4g27595, chloroplastic-like [Amphimedon queenslandica]